ncbi:MAG: beta-lactamase family protein [Candidatus Sumerlaeia bacterium]|nr:beta-lactamase family protein [Candidatus Sumerlaeia bacterium]
MPRTQPATADPRAADIEVLLDAYNREGLFNGIAMVADDGRVIFEKSYGYANEEWGMRPDRHTKFRLASITKQFTALMILQLAEEGKLSLDDTITKHLPWYRQDTGSRITIHQLLTHTSGIPNYSDFSGFFSTGPSRMHYEMREFVEKYCSNDLASEPGESYAYCNSGYYILGAILEEIEGKPWEQVVDERIAQRGGMPDTGAYSHTRLMPRRAQGYRRDSDGTLQPTGHQDMTIWRAAGSMYSTGQDMLQWDRALRENLLLGAEWKEKMFSRQRGSYGYGVNVIRIENPSGETIRYMGHSGSYAGFNNYFCHFPDTGEAVVLLNNGGRTEINAIRDGIANILVGNPYDLPVATHRLTSEGDNPRLAVAKISSQGVISSDDATFQPADAAAGTTIYATNFLLHDGEQVYFANASGGAARIRDGQVHSTAHSLHNRGMTYSGSAWLESDLDIEVTGTDAPRLALSWTFHNRGTEERALRMMWFTDVDLTTAGSSSSHDRLALLPKPGRPGEEAMLVFNHSETGEIDRGSGLLFHVQGVPHHFLGIAGDAGASGYWRSSGPFESIGPRAAGYQIPEDWRGKVQHDEDGDGMTDGPRDVGVSVQADISLPVGASRTVRFLVDFGPRD